MAFQFKPDESVGKAVKRIVRKQLDKVLDELACVAERDEAVHSTRKRFKKVRALLRLVRGEWTDKVYRKENAFYRDAAQVLADVRDALIRVKAAEDLFSRAGSSVAADIQANIRKALQQELCAVRTRVLDEEHAFAAVRSAAEAARTRLKQWGIKHRGWSAIQPGLKRGYQDCRRAFAAARAAPTTEKLHEWRKQVKYFLHHLQLLEPISPEYLQALTGRVDELTKRLGEDHDLAVLRDKLSKDDKSFADDGVPGTLLAEIDRRLQELQEEAFALAEPVHAEEPKVLMERLKQCWKAWRAGAHAVQANGKASADPAPSAASVK